MSQVFLGDFRDVNLNFVAQIRKALILNLLTTTIVAPPSNASKWQMGFNSAFKGLMLSGWCTVPCYHYTVENQAAFHLSANTCIQGAHKRMVRFQKLI